MVCEAFHGPCPDGHEVAHGNGDRSDNRPSNLRWATKPQNMADKHGHGTMFQGERHNRNRLKVEQVLEIRERLTAGEFGTDLAREFGIHQTVISKIKRREIWKHV